MSDEFGKAFNFGIKKAREYWDGWPATIVATRYQGSYEGGLFAAFPMELMCIVDEPWDGSDMSCDKWWSLVNALELPVGRGWTPTEAYDDLMRRMGLGRLAART